MSCFYSTRHNPLVKVALLVLIVNQLYFYRPPTEKDDYRRTVCVCVCMYAAINFSKIVF